MDLSKKMCPLLTAGVLKSQVQPAVEGVVDVSAGFEAMPCQGDKCAFWFTIADERGVKTKDGNCAINLSASALSQISLANPNRSKIVKG